MIDPPDASVRRNDEHPHDATVEDGYRHASRHERGSDPLANIVIGVDERGMGDELVPRAQEHFADRGRVMRGRRAKFERWSHAGIRSTVQRLHPLRRRERAKHGAVACCELGNPFTTDPLEITEMGSALSVDAETEWVPCRTGVDREHLVAVGIVGWSLCGLKLTPSEFDRQPSRRV